MSNNTKICKKCKVEKELTEFYQKKGKTKKLYYSQCKTCERERIKNYKDNNQEKINEHSRNKYKIDPNYRMKKILRSRFKKTVTLKKIYKSVLKYIDIEIDMFLKWMEYQFDEKMNWDNQGTYWDIDHVIPCKNFNLSNEDDVKKCFHWTNTRPLEKIENYKKNDKISEEIINSHKEIVEKFKLTITKK